MTDVPTPEESQELLSAGTAPTERAPWWRIVCASFSYMTVQLSFGFVFALFTPLLTNDLEVPVTWTPLLWWIGPLCGLLQPFLGAWSDGCQSRFGRRRPFILVGTAIVLAGYVLFYFVHDISHALGDREHFHPAGITIAILAMVVLNIAINVVMGPSRAIVCDLSAGGRESFGNNMISLMIGAANLISNLVVFLVTSSATPFIIGVILVILSVIPTLFFAKEKQYKRAPGTKIPNPCVRIFRALRTMRGPVLRACIVFFLSWAAYFPSPPTPPPSWGPSTTAPPRPGRIRVRSDLKAFAAALMPAMLPAMMPGGASFVPFMFQPASMRYFGAAVGDDAFEQGKRVGAAAIAASSLVTALFSAISTWLMNLIGLKVTYFAAQLIATGAYVGLFFASTTVEVFIYFCLIGINFSLFNSVPFALVSESVGESDAGLYAGGMNIFCVAAQFVSLGITSGVSAIWPHNMEFIMLACAILSLVATGLVPILKRGKKNAVQTTTEVSDRLPLNSEDPVDPAV
ncbi:Glycoside-Pentoside-Hexuronide:Cation Symporter (MFS) [Paratrimastix pyriformis]|uniref:Glycoside-Pentoside-Hexuronide:Cation Symporter (MFS) n=1 Tax=Paratrimastix pyriformis TaxID=342808 RepID=A0ABQ8UY63_9EUKA|nr:Glycoside-Pentoside-Hexuronide:Cation Symporter (MFS) [Paratrimastix pyriformis]